MKKIIVIIPSYNESANIEQTITELLKQKEEFNNKGLEFKIYVVNDGSNDNTLDLAQKASASRVISHKINLGLGAAVRTGITEARKDGADIIVKFDADQQHDPKDIFALILPLLNDEADVVYGNRFERIEYKMPIIRKMGNIVFTSLMRWLTGWQLKDSQPGIFAINKSYFENFYIPGDYNYTQQILIDAYHKGMRFTHVPVSFRKREKGKSFVSFKYPFKVLPQIIMVLIGVKPMKVFAPLGLTFFCTGSFFFCLEFIAWMTGKTPKPVVHVNAIMGLLLFGLQTLFFGMLAHLIVEMGKKKW